ncbi:MAG: 2,3-bisphosphoglycerate-independent phosphoglycerate mutase [Candidatus Hydrogenedentes bacterium]|nr:2,3-bisphosphoglycerate-independent phosphoglycerate mutase [Candidatus Hydrogenedentota bacterium]
MEVRQLEKLGKAITYPGPLVLVIMDGIGIGKRDESDGVYLAYTPTLDMLFEEPLFTKLKAHGTAVGLPTDEDMGNSEVGHNALGAGRVFAQGARLVNEAIASGRLFKGNTWLKVMERAKSGGTIHFIGLLSDGNVHSHIDQLLAIIRHCAGERVQRIRVHILTDGRDVPERSALIYIEQLEKVLEECRNSGLDYKIASGGGRMLVTMDRYEADWRIVERGWKAHVLGEGRKFSSAREAVEYYYAQDPNVNDQFLGEFVIVENGKPVGTIEDGDAVIFFNFRGDRAIEISRAFEEDDFPYFDRKRRPDVFYAGMMQYDGDKLIPKNYLVEPPMIEGTISEFLCATGITSYAVSETQKFGHVTYFWNGNKSGYICEELELFEEVPSDRVPFQERPWMKAGEITDAVLKQIREGKYKFIRLNFANGDMVGHTGVAQAVRIAVEAVDLSLGRIYNAVKEKEGILVVTADHGNADLLFTEKKGKREPHVAHTLNPVPFIIKDFSGKNRIKLSGVENPGLSNVASTLINLLGYKAPEEYDPSLIVIE